MFVRFAFLAFFYSTISRADGGRAVVLPTQLDGNAGDLASWLPEYDRRVSKAVERTGKHIVPATPIPNCLQLDCLQIVSRDNQADTVVAPRIVVDDQKPAGYHVSVVVFNAIAQERREEGEDCPSCYESKAADLLYAAATKALAPPALDPWPSPQPQQKRISSTTLAALTGLSFVVAVGGVAVASIGGLVLDENGKSTCSGPSRNCPTVFDTTAQGGAMLGVGVALFAGGLVGAILTIREWRHRRPVESASGGAL